MTFKSSRTISSSLIVNLATPFLTEALEIVIKELTLNVLTLLSKSIGTISETLESELKICFSTVKEDLYKGTIAKTEGLVVLKIAGSITIF